MAQTTILAGIMILAAVVLPGFCILVPGALSGKKHIAMTIASMCACGIAICAFLFEVNYRVGVADWSALMDLTDNMAAFSAGLVAIIAGLNVVAAVRVHKAS